MKMFPDSARTRVECINTRGRDGWYASITKMWCLFAMWDLIPLNMPENKYHTCYIRINSSYLPQKMLFVYKCSPDNLVRLEIDPGGCYCGNLGVLSRLRSVSVAVSFWKSFLYKGPQAEFLCANKGLFRKHSCLLSLAALWCHQHLDVLVLVLCISTVAENLEHLHNNSPTPSCFGYFSTTI